MNFYKGLHTTPERRTAMVENVSSCNGGMSPVAIVENSNSGKCLQLQ